MVVILLIAFAITCIPLAVVLLESGINGAIALLRWLQTANQVKLGIALAAIVGTILLLLSFF